ncbi:replication protein A 70 kDa DNA-binding subunit B-like isoform X1 [Asparagus officinalis]|uniref:replication protein A 70 kDa DNA-binding subunit B-like isoform X1 n=1 Tax=Asparagus officinalis TaxID=4686 RepID=UPI00098E4C02|nr:replication protein A 70 kDa DNA-binding subunit B-like isoform X1 [Asparagus officinalis]
MFFKYFRFDQISVTLWGDLAEIEGSSLENLKDAKPVVALLSVIGRRYLGEFQLSTKSSTLVLVNPEIPQCREMIDWLRNSNSESSKSVLLTPTKRITQANRVKLTDVINTSPQLSKGDINENN